MKRLILFMLLIMIAQASALTLTDDLVFKGINEDNVFTTLISNKADITGGESIFIIDNPFNELDLNKTLFFDWYVASGLDYTSYGFEVGTIIEESNPVYEWNEYNYTCYYVENITLEILNDTCQMSLKNQTGVENISHLVWSKNTTIGKGTHMIKFKATWNAHLGPQETDWVPEVFLNKQDFNLTEDIQLRKIVWAWYNTSWNYYKEYTNLTGNISYMFINATANDNADFNDTRFISCYNDTLEFNHTLEAKIGTFGQFRVNNLGENCTRRYYGNAAVTSTSNASKVYFEPISAWYLDANANDFIGSNHGTVNGAILTSGYINGSYDFDGSGDYIDINSFNPTGSSGTLLSVSTWTNAGIQSHQAQSPLISQYDFLGSKRAWVIDDASGDGKIRIRCTEAGAGGDSRSFISTNIILDGTWKQIGFTWNSGSITVFVNGISIPGSTSGTGTFIGNLNSDINIGRYAGSTTYIWNGLIDEVLIYDKVLTSTQIYQLYTQTAPNFIEGAEQSQDSPPTYSDQSVNNTVANQSTKFSILWDDDISLNSSGQYIFSTNNTGAWTNDSAINFTTTPNWANVTKTLNSTVGLSIGYRWYATDNTGNANATDIFSLTTTSAVEDTCTYVSGNWEIECSDNCSITSNVNLGNNDMVFNGSGYFYVAANIVGIDNLNLSSWCDIILNPGNYMVL